jgi:hypothetical protein
MSNNSLYSNLLQAIIEQFERNAEAAAYYRWVSHEPEEMVRRSDMPGIERAASKPKTAPVIAEPVSRAKPALAGLTTVSRGDHRLGAWK